MSVSGDSQRTRLVRVRRLYTRVWLPGAAGLLAIALAFHPGMSVLVILAATAISICLVGLVVISVQIRARGHRRH